LSQQRILQEAAEGAESWVWGGIALIKRKDPMQTRIFTADFADRADQERWNSMNQNFAQPGEVAEFCTRQVICVNLRNLRFNSASIGWLV
jgi:hypothetical protein